MAPRRVHPEQQEATTAEFKALAHPLRLRILRMCLHDAMTNQQFAQRLGLDPATTLHHVRTLVRTGFIAAEPLRTGTRGALEKPYRATKRSWVLAIPRPGDRLTTVIASVDALRAELLDAGAEALVTNTRLGLRLSDAEVAELAERLKALMDDYAQRPATAGGRRVGLFATLHHLP
ncbi:MAG: winged helix-turn-helix domain-containing protein [Ilumatobacteraceae bacterium]